MTSKTKVKTDDVKRKLNDDVKSDSREKLKVDPKLSAESLINKLNLPKHAVEDIMKYPTNVCVKDLVMFMLIPTLNFQLEYPIAKTKNIKKFVLYLVLYVLLMLVYVSIILEY